VLQGKRHEGTWGVPFPTPVKHGKPNHRGSQKKKEKKYRANLKMGGWQNGISRKVFFGGDKEPEKGV